MGEPYENSVTATSDSPFQIDTDPNIVLKSANIHVFTNDAYYGTVAFQRGIISKDAVVWFDSDFQLSKFWFKNKTAGANCTVVIVGVLA
jgi:hypothetical protein